jgi:hypothetical protein
VLVQQRRYPRGYGWSSVTRLAVSTVATVDTVLVARSTCATGPAGRGAYARSVCDLAGTYGSAYGSVVGGPRRGVHPCSFALNA